MINEFYFKYNISRLIKMAFFLIKQRWYFQDTFASSSQMTRKDSMGMLSGIPKFLQVICLCLHFWYY